MCQDDCCCRFAIFGPISIVFALIGMLCLTAGYYNNSNFNSGLTKATCVVGTSYVVTDQCSYPCNCYTNNNNAWVCQTCYYTCYNGDVVAAIAGVTPGSILEVISGLDTSNDVLNYLNGVYPNGKSFTCFYNSNSNNTGQTDIYLGTKDAIDSFIAGLVFCGLACVVLLTYLIIEIIAGDCSICDFMNFICGPCLDCFNDCDDSCRRARLRHRASRQSAKLARAREMQEMQNVRDAEIASKREELALKEREFELQRAKQEQLQHEHEQLRIQQEADLIVQYNQPPVVEPDSQGLFVPLQQQPFVQQQQFTPPQQRLVPLHPSAPPLGVSSQLPHPSIPHPTAPPLSDSSKGV